MTNGARFSKVLKLFGHISGEIILFVCSKRRRLQARNFGVVLIFIPSTRYEKTSFTQWAGWSFTNGFLGSKRFRDFREKGPWSSFQTRVSFAGNSSQFGRIDGFRLQWTGWSNEQNQTNSSSLSLSGFSWAELLSLHLMRRLKFKLNHTNLIKFWFLVRERNTQGETCQSRVENQPTQPK